MGECQSCAHDMRLYDDHAHSLLFSPDGLLEAVLPICAL
jgi:hypothetical protein